MLKDTGPFSSLQSIPICVWLFLRDMILAWIELKAVLIGKLQALSMCPVLWKVTEVWLSEVL